MDSDPQLWMENFSTVNLFFFIFRVTGTQIFLGFKALHPSARICTSTGRNPLACSSLIGRGRGQCYRFTESRSRFSRPEIKSISGCNKSDFSLFFYTYNSRRISVGEEAAPPTATVGAQSIPRVCQNLINCRRNISAHRRCRELRIYLIRKILSSKMI